MKLIVSMIREIFKDAESVRSGPSHVPSQTALLAPFRDPGGMLGRLGNVEPQQWAAKFLGYAWYIGKRFLQIQPASSSAPYPG